MGCIYNGVCSSLIALFLWQQVTNLAALTAHCGISPNTYGSLSKLDLFSNSLWGCVIGGQELQLSFHLILWAVYMQPFSIARLCSLSLYVGKAFLKFGSVTVVRYSATVYSRSPNSILVCSVFLLILSNVSSTYFCFLMIWLGLIQFSNLVVVLGLCGVCL